MRQSPAQRTRRSSNCSRSRRTPALGHSLRIGAACHDRDSSPLTGGSVRLHCGSAPMNLSRLILIAASFVVTAAACVGPWAGVAGAVPIHNTLNNVWIDEKTNQWYDNLTEAGANQRRQASNRDVEQMDLLMSTFL